MQHFMITHDQNLLSSTMINMFVGNGHIDIDTSEDLNRVLVCRDLPFNLEQYPYLCSFTAWYAVAKNNLAKSNNITLIEYDTTIKSNNLFYHKLNHDSQIICYSITLFDHYVFYKSTPWLEISLKKIYGIDLKQFVKDHKDQHKFWPTTTNITLSKDTLNRFVDWFLPMTEIFRDCPLGAYVHERAFFIFCVLNKIQIVYSQNTMNHNQAVSHKIIDFYGSFLASKNSMELKKSMIPEYDKLYNDLFRSCLEKSPSC